MDIQWPLNLPQALKGGGRSSTNSLKLRAGDVLTASVLEVDKGRDALISLGQFRAYARLPLPVVTGQKIQIQIQQGDQGLRMMMVPSTSRQSASPVSTGGNAQVINPSPEKGLPFAGEGRIPASPLPTANNSQVINPSPEKGLPPAGEGRISASPLPAGNNSQVINPSPEKGLPPAGEGRIPASAAPASGNPRVDMPSADKGPLPADGRIVRTALATKNENLPIRLFEPVSDRPFISAHAHMLRPGETVEGRITGFGKDGLMLVDFGKFKAFAKIDVPVREGQILPLVVAKNDQTITFSIGTRPLSRSLSSQRAFDAGQPLTGGSGKSVPMDQAVQASLPAILSDSRAGRGQSQGAALFRPPAAAEMAQFREQIQQLLVNAGLPERPSGEPLPTTTRVALTHLQQFLRPIATHDDTTALMAGIRDFVENSGIYFEKRVEAAIRNLQDRSTPIPPTELAQKPPIRELMVKDLKPNLLILNQFLDSQPLDQHTADRHLLETMKSVVQRALAHIEQQQQGAAEKPVDPDLLQAFSHLLLLADTRRDARLKVYYAKKGRRGEANRTPRVALLLEMDRMGTVRTDLWMVGKDLNITFFVQTPETQTAIKAALDEIKTALNQTFNTVVVGVVVNENKINQFDDEDGYSASHRLLDLKI